MGCRRAKWAESALRAHCTGQFLQRGCDNRSQTLGYSIVPQTTANLRLVWVGVQAMEQLHLKQTANFHCKQWRLTFDGSVSFGWVQT